MNSCLLESKILQLLFTFYFVHDMNQHTTHLWMRVLQIRDHRCSVFKVIILESSWGPRVKEEVSVVQSSMLHLFISWLQKLKSWWFRFIILPVLMVNFLAVSKVEDLLKNYENVCTLRVRMPISSDLSNPRNFITKITRYEKVVDIPNSMTILDELLPISIEMAKRNLTGIWNFTNPGVVSHNEILEMYRDYIDPNFTWKNFTLEEQAKVIVAPRSNNELDATKLKTEFPELLSIKESLIQNVFKPNQKTSAAWKLKVSIFGLVCCLLLDFI